jgi:UDP-galactopyranose mutase
VSADWLVVGAGLTGATLAERIASVLGDTVTVVERRSHVGGNAHDAPNEHGVLVHTYGPHIFHTNSDEVWRYLNEFTAWRPYEHHVLGVIDDRRVPVPINLNSIEALFPRERASRLIAMLIERYGLGAKVPVLKMRGEPDELGELAAFVYAKVFLGYTIKQWSLRPEELAPSVTARVPIHVSRDNRYFQDRYQAIPLDGYTAMIQKMLDHPKISLKLGTSYQHVQRLARGARVVFTGPIDEFFDYAYGPLPYRTMRFEPETVQREWALEAGSLNFPDIATPFTRITEMKRLTGQAAAVTTLVREYPEAHVPSVTEPHYPIPTEATRELYARYRALSRTRPNVLFCGRLGEYRYYNMDQAVAAALALFRKEIAGGESAALDLPQREDAAADI